MSDRVATRYCRPCWRLKGKPVPAVEIIDGTPLCANCFVNLDKEEPMPKRLGAETEKKILELHSAGKKIGEIAEETGTAWGTVQSRVKKLPAHGAARLLAPREVVDPSLMIKPVRPVKEEPDPRQPSPRPRSRAIPIADPGAGFSEEQLCRMLDVLWGRLPLREKARLLLDAPEI
jgi:hypothetical protein